MVYILTNERSAKAAGGGDSGDDDKLKLLAL